MIRPPIIPQLSLPSPKHPPLLPFIRRNLRRKPPGIELRIRIRIPIRARLDIVSNGQTPFAHDVRRVAVQVVAAGGADVAVVRGVDVGPF